MWKILIADDETRIRRGLEGMIRAMPIQAEVVGTAGDGEAALTMARELMPDIILADICMPFCSGLELIEALRELRHDMKIIVITGFEEFAYAKRALELSVYAYLLKPVEAEELLHKLQGATAELAAQREHRKHYAFAMEQLQKRKDILTETFLRDVLDDAYSPEEITERCALLDLSSKQPYDLLLVAPPPEGADTRPAHELVFRYELEGALAGYMQECKGLPLFPDARGNVMLLLPGGTAGSSAQAENLEALVQQELGVAARVAHTSLKGLNELPEAYDRLISSVFEGGAGRSAIVAAAQAYIAKAYMRPELGLADVAAEAGVTPTYLSRLMKQELGMSFSKYLTTKRVTQAIRLMEKGMLLKEIAVRVGYSSPYYFSTAFKKTLSIPPNEYRSEVLKK